MRLIALTLFLVLLPSMAFALDSYEPDNSWSASHNIPTNGSRQQHDFHVEGDVDYVNFTAVAGWKYVIETYNLTNIDITDTELTLYNTTGTTPLDYNDDIQSGTVRTSRIVFRPTTNGTYYVKVSEYYSSAGGIYEISIDSVDADDYEPDDTSPSAKIILTNGSRQEHSFHTPSDVDYVNFTVVSGSQYIIETFNMETLFPINTTLTLYDKDGTTQIDYNNDIEGESIRNSRIVFTARLNGTYYAKIADYYNSTGNLYEISITQIGRMIPEIVTPNINSNVVRENVFEFTSKLTCLGGTCYNISATLDPEQKGSKKNKKEVAQYYEKKIEDEVIGALKATNNVPVIVILNEKTDEPTDSRHSIKSADYTEESLRRLGEGIKLKHKYSSFPAFSGAIDSSAIYTLASDPNVKAVYLDREVHALLTSTVPLIRANSVWPMQVNGTNVTGAGQTICIIDTGINYSHADFGGCSLTGNINDGSCAKVVGGYDFVNSDSNPNDDNGHGSHVAGIAASMDTIYSGVAPSAKIVAIKSLNAAGSGIYSNVIAGIDWCVSNAARLNISVISMSLGDDTYTYNFHCAHDSMKDAIDSAKTAGISVVIASGNNGNTDGIDSPACVESAISVGGVNNADSIVYNRAQVLDVLSPGISVTATDYSGTHTSMSGTSMSTPHVAGVIALIQQYNRLKNNRSLTVEETRHILRYNGRWLYDSGSTQEFPRIDAYASVNAKGVIPTTAGAKPFYSITPNPHNASCLSQLNDGESCNITWQVVPTGDTNSTYTFFVVYETDYRRNLTSTVNLTIVTGPAITLNQPPDASYLANQSAAFNCSASNEFGLSNITLWGNFNGTWMANSTINISGTSNTSSWQVSIYDGSYAWNCRACNSLGNCVFNAANYSLFIDAAKPVITALNYSSIVELGYSQYIQANATNGNMDYCNVSYGGLNITMLNDTFDHFYYNFTPEANGSRAFVIYAFDKAGNFNFTNGSFIVNDSTDEPYIRSVTNEADSLAYGSRQTITALAYDKLPLTLLLDHNGTNVTMSNSSSYNFTYSWNTSQCGAVNYTVYANNSGYSSTATGSFSATDCCGNSICESGESCSNCASDCGQCQASSSGGGGGGGVTQRQGNTETVVVPEASPEKPVEAAISNPAIPVDAVKIEVLNKVLQAKVTVAAMEKSPAEVLPGAKVYKYLEIKAEKIQQENIKKASVEFSVKNDWLSSNNVAKYNIALFRYSGGWKEQPTEYIMTIGDKHFYSADVEGFSYFAIGEAKKAEEKEAPKEEFPKQEEKPVTSMAIKEEQKKAPETIWTRGFVIAWLITVTLFYIAGIAYIVISKRKAAKRK